jgi:hypothetical protein
MILPQEVIAKRRFRSTSAAYCKRLFTLERLIFIVTIFYLWFLNPRQTCDNKLLQQKPILVLSSEIDKGENEVVRVEDASSVLQQQLPSNNNGKRQLFISENDMKIALLRISDQIKDILSWDEKDFKKCQLKNVGSGFGMHKICTNLLEYNKDLSCVIMSYGTATDYSFDSEIQTKTGCKVFALDPTVTHPSVLAPNVYFLQFAAPGVDNQKNWVELSPTKLAGVVIGPNNPVPVLKMDCEGCEYKIFDDIIENDPQFFTRVKQFAIEIHLSKYWMKTKEDATKLASLFALLFASGHDLMHAYMTPCAVQHENYGCNSYFINLGYTACVTGKMCQNLLFAKV